MEEQIKVIKGQVDYLFNKPKYSQLEDSLNGIFHDVLQHLDKLTVKPKREPWKPKIGDTYFCITDTFQVSPAYILVDDNLRYAKGNCFRTREEAEAFLEKIKKLREEIK